MRKHWKNSADEYICPECGFTTYNPSIYPGCVCPICGFQDEKDAHPICDCFSSVVSYSPTSRKKYTEFVCYSAKEIEECIKEKKEKANIPKGTNNYAIYYAHLYIKHGGFDNPFRDIRNIDI